MNAQTHKKGFTIIEVVLVLAIAGLIFLMVFIALPALQRSQRDSQREQDLSRAQTAIQQYQSNNRNVLPTNWTTFATQYLKATGGADSEFVDPSGKSYRFTALAVGAAAPTTVDSTDSSQTTVRIFYTTAATCATDGAVTGGQGSRKVALRVVLEGGGVACVNN
jgi:prepilin-type N-terminal cleavage/methylation domain-containing protein